MKRFLTLLSFCLLGGAVAFAQPFGRMITPPTDPSYRMEVARCTSDGKTIYGKAFIPVSPGKHPAVILSHGYGGTHHGFYEPAHVELYHHYVLDFLKRHLK